MNYEKIIYLGEIQTKKDKFYLRVLEEDDRCVLQLLKNDKGVPKWEDVLKLE